MGAGASTSTDSIIYDSFQLSQTDDDENRRLIWLDWLCGIGMGVDAASRFSIYLLHKKLYYPQQLMRACSANTDFFREVICNGILTESEAFLLLTSKSYQDYRKNQTESGAVSIAHRILELPRNYQENYPISASHNQYGSETAEEMLALFESVFGPTNTQSFSPTDSLVDSYSASQFSTDAGSPNRQFSSIDDYVVISTAGFMDNSNELAIIFVWSPELSSGSLELTRNCSRAFRERAEEDGNPLPAAVAPVLVCKVCATIRLDSTPKKNGDFSFGFGIRAFRSAESSETFGWEDIHSWGIVNMETCSEVYERGSLVCKCRLLLAGDKMSISINLFKDCAYLFLNGSPVAVFEGLDVQTLYVVGATLSTGQCITLAHDRVYCPDDEMATFDQAQRQNGATAGLTGQIGESDDDEDEEKEEEDGSRNGYSATYPHPHECEAGDDPHGLSRSMSDFLTAHQPVGRRQQATARREETVYDVSGGRSASIAPGSLESDDENDDSGRRSPPRLYLGLSRQRNRGGDVGETETLRHARSLRHRDDELRSEAMASLTQPVSPAVVRRSAPPAPVLSAAAMRRIEMSTKATAAMATAVAAADIAAGTAPSGSNVSSSSASSSSRGADRPSSLYVPVRSPLRMAGERVIMSPSTGLHMPTAHSRAGGFSVSRAGVNGGGFGAGAGAGAGGGVISGGSSFGRVEDDEDDLDLYAGLGSDYDAQNTVISASRRQQSTAMSTLALQQAQSVQAVINSVLSESLNQPSSSSSSTAAVVRAGVTTTGSGPSVHLPAGRAIGAGAHGLAVSSYSEVKSKRSSPPKSKTATAPAEIGDSSLSQLCCICMEGAKCVVLLPCRHMCLCEGCGIGAESSLRLCPICREHIQQSFRIFT